jgi:hypothetical protein
MSASRKKNSPLRWARLPHRQQAAIVRRLINEQQQGWLGRYPAMITVGFGVRHKQRKRQEKLAPALLFLVTRKKKQKHGRNIPPRVRVQVSRRGRETVWIPTDVLEVRNLRLHATFPFASCNAAKGELVEGSACCALTDTAGTAAKYVLGCHHVFLASENSPGMAPGPVAYVACQGTQIGTVPDDCRGMMNPGSPPTEFSNDAALVEIEDGGRQALANYWTATWYPAGIERDSKNIPTAAGSYAVYTTRGPLAAKYVGHFGSYPVPVNGGQSILVPEVYLYDAYCVQGDSGSPFYDVVTRTVQGMHFAGADSGDTGSGYLCMAEPVWRLTSATYGPFEKDLFYAQV